MTILRLPCPAGLPGIARLRLALLGLTLLGPMILGGCAQHLNAAQIAVLKQEGFQDKGVTWELGLSNKMLFDTGSAVVKPETQAAVERTGAMLKSVDIRNIRVEGHTDNVGADDYNMELSQRRAQMIAAALDKAGNTGKIGAQGFGKKVPVADNATEAGRAENRRVSVIVPDNQD